METKTLIVSNLAGVGEFFGVPVSTCEYWRKQGLPGKPGRWDLGEIVRWRLAKLDTAGDLSAELKRADIRLKTAQSEQRELETSIQRGELLDRGDVERWCAQFIVEARETLMGLPEMLATSSPPELRNFVREESDRHVRDVLATLRRRLESDELDRETVPTSTE